MIQRHIADFWPEPVRVLRSPDEIATARRDAFAAFTRLLHGTGLQVTPAAAARWWHYREDDPR